MRRNILNVLKQFLEALMSTMNKQPKPVPAPNNALETINKLRGQIEGLKQERDILRTTTDELKRSKESALAKIKKLEVEFADMPTIIDDLKLQLATVEQERETLGEEFYVLSLKYKEYEQEQDAAKELIAQMVKGMERN